MKPLTDRELLELIASRVERLEKGMNKIRPAKKPREVKMDVSKISLTVKKHIKNSGL